jgi:hypothetical protein
VLYEKETAPVLEILLIKKKRGTKMSSLMLIVVASILIVGAIIVGIISLQILKKADSIELVQGKLENSDSAIEMAIPYLKITNEWSE